ncbi:MAG: hypothetical protein HUU25_14590, partial [Candidatus Sumerlaeia bacterium]|nr:hypothetical protein [Candidatus Sumerlaeia bacterium]
EAVASPSPLVDAGSRDFWNDGITATGAPEAGHAQIDNPTQAQADNPALAIDDGEVAVAHDSGPEDVMDIGYHHLGEMRHPREPLRGTSDFTWEWSSGQGVMVQGDEVDVDPTVYLPRGLDIASGHYDSGLQLGMTIAVAGSESWDFIDWSGAPAHATVPDPARSGVLLPAQTSGGDNAVSILYQLYGGDRDGTPVHGVIRTVVPETMDSISVKPVSGSVVVAAAAVPQPPGGEHDYFNTGTVYAAIAVTYDEAKLIAGDFSNIFVYRYDGADDGNYDDDWTLIGERSGASHVFEGTPEEPSTGGEFDTDHDNWRLVHSLALCAGDAGPYVFWTESLAGSPAAGLTLRGMFVPDDSGLHVFHPVGDTSTRVIASEVPLAIEGEQVIRTGVDAAFDAFQSLGGAVAGQPRIVYTDYHRDMNGDPVPGFYVVASTPIRLNGDGADAWDISPTQTLVDREELFDNADSDNPPVTDRAINPGVAVNEATGWKSDVARVFAVVSFRDDSEAADRPLWSRAFTAADDDTWVTPMAVVPASAATLGGESEQYLDVTGRFSGRPRFLRWARQLTGLGALVTDTELFEDLDHSQDHFPRLTTSVGNETDVFALAGRDSAESGPEEITIYHLDP